VVRNAVKTRTNAGDEHTTLIEGLDLLGPKDADGFSGDGVHPNDLGFNLIAERISTRLSSWT
ncbi:MAG: hypothetical protein QGG53_21635, partial [Planctomycetota bacterium]|nr:hypothetical protein [Planctomycetota bacterium]